MYINDTQKHGLAYDNDEWLLDIIYMWFIVCVYHLCDSADIGDEFHYIMSCNYLKQERGKYLPSYCYNNVNTFKFKELFSSCNVIVLEKLCKFIKIVSMKVPPPGQCKCNFSTHVQNLICCILLFTSL